MDSSLRREQRSSGFRQRQQWLRVILDSAGSTRGYSIFPPQTRISNISGHSSAFSARTNECPFLDACPSFC